MMIVVALLKRSIVHLGMSARTMLHCMASKVNTIVAKTLITATPGMFVNDESAGPGILASIWMILGGMEKNAMGFREIQSAGTDG